MGGGNQQGRPEREPSTTTRRASQRDDDIVCSAWRHAEAGGNDRPRRKASNKTWSVDYKTDKIDTSNFEGLGYDQSIIGLLGADWTLAGLWDASGNQQLTDPPGLYPRYDLGTTNLYLNVAASSFWSFPQSAVASAKNSTQVRDAVKFDVSASANGTFGSGVPSG